MKHPLFLLSLVAFWAATASGATLHVPTDHGSIRDAFTFIQEGDTVLLAPGTYNEVGLVALQPITLLGDPEDPSTVVIDGRGLGRILHCEAAGTYRVAGITFRDGNASDTNGIMGGGVYANRTTYLSVRNCRFTGCDATTGGGVAILSGMARIQDCRFDDNTGSGLYTQGTALELFDCGFTGNLGLHGGAYRQNNGSALVDGCRFEGNTADQKGGALSAENASVHECEFLDNRAEMGGAIDAYNLVGRHLSISDNRARLGAAIYMRYRVELHDCILAHNIGDLIVHSVATSDYSLLHTECCCLFPASTGGWANRPNEPGEESLVYADPLFCDPGSGDLGLAAASPCLPAGNPCSNRLGASNGGECGRPAVHAAFRPVQDWVLMGHMMQFMDLSSAWATRWSWDFNGDGRIDSQEQNPRWAYGEGGTWTVTLIAADSLGSDTLSLDDCVTSYRPRTVRVPESMATVRQALESTTRGDTISVACGVHAGYGLSVPSGVSIVGRTGNPECVVLDAGGLGRVFHLVGADSSTVISGLTITGGLVNGPGLEGAGAGMLLEDSSPLVRHCIVWDNTATLGGGVCISWDSRPAFESCTIAGNHGASLAPAVLATGDTGTFRRCILWGNTPGPPVFGGPAFECSDINGNPGGDWVGEIEGQVGIAGNFSRDPHFCDPQDGRFRLENDSPCFGATCGVVGANPLDCQGTDLEPPSRPTTRDLLVCYPNPFNTQLGIRYDPRVAGELRIRLVDLLGRTVREWNGRSADGSPGRLHLEGEGLASGVYFVQFENGTLRESRKVVLVK